LERLIPPLFLSYFLFAFLHQLQKRIYLILGLVGLGLYFVFYAFYLDKFYFSLQVLFLTIASIFLLFVAPFLDKKDVKNIDIFYWMKWVSYSLLSSMLLSFLLYIAIILAFGAIDFLLGINIRDKIYALSGVIIFGVFGANYFLENLREFDFQNQPQLGALQTTIAKYFLPTFAIFYLAILYIYTAQILITSSWPKGGLAWFILIFSIVTFSAHFNLIPYQKNKIQKLFLIVIIPQAFMLLLAVYKRIEVYSITESRHMLVVYGLFLIIISLYFLLKRGATYRAFFVGIAVMIFLSQVGITSGLFISKKAQTARLKDNLKLFYDGNHSKELTKEISSQLYYLIQHYGIDGVDEVLPEIVSEYKNKKFPLFSEASYNVDIECFVAKKIGFEYNGKGYCRDSKVAEEKQNNLYCEKSPISVKGFDYLVDGVFYSYKDEESFGIDKEKFKAVLKGNQMTISFHNQSKKIDLTPYIKKLFETKACKDIRAFEYEDDNIKLKLIPRGSIKVKENKFEYLKIFLLFSKKS
jgi:hypothetical protein